MSNDIKFHKFKLIQYAAEKCGPHGSCVGKTLQDYACEYVLYLLSFYIINDIR